MSLKPGVYTPEEAAAAIEADAQGIADEYGTLKDRVAALESAMSVLLPLSEPLTEAQAAEFRARYAEAVAVKGPPLVLPLETDESFLARLKRVWPELVRWEMKRTSANRGRPPR